jgi:sigma-E factor negative regulatory protein RseA
MNEERQSELPGERHSERDSQLSAMFDGELPAAECELLARRLTRDETLRGQWSRYALVGAALRAERGVKLHDRVADRVQAALAQEAVYDEGDTASRELPAARESLEIAAPARSRLRRFAAPLGGVGIAAGVAALSIFALRVQDVPAPLVADAAMPMQTAVEVAPVSAAESAPAESVRVADATPRASSGEPERYVTPTPSSTTVIAPSARLANYVVAHSEYSSPLSRRLALLGLVGTEIQGDAANDDAAGTPQSERNKPAEQRALGAGSGPVSGTKNAP